ncbi:hypothetical protein OUZ56_032481 [Daphnia magna]|uniref:Uncharacterized protein n=1 Tax=Daphnia magna TaxID=35525 RepID=A0ABR0B916_9CRUS|nr:hypothetical protein OUZ56_032481 [Daphnia magna]
MVDARKPHRSRWPRRPVVAGPLRFRHLDGRSRSPPNRKPRPPRLRHTRGGRRRRPEESVQAPKSPRFLGSRTHPAPVPRGHRRAPRRGRKGQPRAPRRAARQGDRATDPAEFHTTDTGIGGAATHPNASGLGAKRDLGDAGKFRNCSKKTVPEVSLPADAADFCRGPQATRPRGRGDFEDVGRGIRDKARCRRRRSGSPKPSAPFSAAPAVQTPPLRRNHRMISGQREVDGRWVAAILAPAKDGHCDSGRQSKQRAGWAKGRHGQCPRAAATWAASTFAITSFAQCTKMMIPSTSTRLAINGVDEVAGSTPSA